MRQTRVVPVSLEVPKTEELPPEADRFEYNLDNVCEAVDRAARWNPDFVVFPEAMLRRWCTADQKEECAQPIPGPATDRVGELAAAHDTYVWLPMPECDGERRYNALALLGPDGSVVGTYRKLRPTVGEIEGGTSPGTSLPTWETPFGRVAGLVCFDLKYPELGVELARQGVDLLFFSTHLQGRALMAHWAREHGLHVVKAHQSTAEVVRPTGETVARNAGEWAGQEPLESLDAGGEARYAFAELNADWGVFGRTPANRQAVEALQADGRAVVYHDFSDDETFALESRERDATVADVVDEYGLERYRDWLDRTGRAAVDAGGTSLDLTGRSRRVAPDGDGD
ncbi:carbon-nitrogen hydrolase family protein [Halomarina oriensis]|uniref:CN hydrolase domain-containing protein n=1 Tax=Halomarina oriensis TaxID=671145 RepID=A0A6B0GKA2_9EURY|nr:carbon-nitrogen hydrolase family protein [Halomarina oriensis]MWG33839.1 hypothetical protein [Halomarina oriensis]